MMHLSWNPSLDPGCPDEVELAKAEWRAANWGKGRFDLPADDRNEHIALPD